MVAAMADNTAHYGEGDFGFPLWYFGRIIRTRNTTNWSPSKIFLIGIIIITVVLLLFYITNNYYCIIIIIIYYYISLQWFIIIIIIIIIF